MKNIARDLFGMIKLSAIAPAFIVLLSTGAFWGCSRIPGGEPRTSETAQASDQDQEKPDKTLQPFESIAGTPYLAANIVKNGWEGSRSGVSSGSSKRGGGDVRNLVFLDSGSLASHRLFDTNEYNILEAQQYPLSNREAKQSKKTTRFLYQVVKKDTDENDYLGAGDHRTIAISDAFGKQYVEVLTEISQILNLKPLNSERLLAVYVQKGKKMASIIDLEQRAVVKTDAIANLGPDVK